MYAPSPGVDSVGLGLIVIEGGALLAIVGGLRAYQHVRALSGSAGWRVIFLPGAIYRTALGGFIALMGLVLVASGLTHL